MPHCTHFDSMKRSCGASGVVEERAFGTGADAGQAHRAGVAVDGDRAERRAGRQRDLALRHRRVQREMLDRERRASCACRRSSANVAATRTRQRGRPRPDGRVERGDVGAVDDAGNARPGSPAPARSCRRSASGAQRLAILRRLGAGREHRDLRSRRSASAREPDVEADRRDVMHLERNHARRQALAAARERAIAARPSAAWSSRQASRPPALA